MYKATEMNLTELNIGSFALCSAESVTYLVAS